IFRPGTGFRRSMHRRSAALALPHRFGSFLGHAQRQDAGIDRTPPRILRGTACCRLPAGAGPRGPPLPTFRRAPAGGVRTRRRKRERAGPPKRDSSMANKMLIDATHPEETRVVVVRGNRVEEFDFESASRRQLRGNIYLAKVTRVEPSLQAAFVEYGGTRNGPRAFSEGQPDYYRRRAAHRRALSAEAGRPRRGPEKAVDRRAGGRGRGGGAGRRRDRMRSEPVRPTEGEPMAPAAEPTTGHEGEAAEFAAEPYEAVPAPEGEIESPPETTSEPAHESAEASGGAMETEPHTAAEATLAPDEGAEAAADERPPEHAEAAEASGDGGDVSAEAAPAGARATDDSEGAEAASGNSADENGDEEEVVESVGGDDALEEATE